MNFYTALVNEFVNDLFESSLPPGFSSNDVSSIEDFVHGSKLDLPTNTNDTVSTMNETENQLVAPDSPLAKNIDMEPMLRNKAEKGGKSDHETPYIHKSSIMRIVDEDGKEMDLDKLALAISQKPKNILQQNAKIQHSGGKTYTFANLTLPAYRGLWYDQSAKEFKIITTCPSAGACKNFCYARKGGYVQYDRVFLNSTRLVNFLLNDWQGFKAQLLEEISEANRVATKKGYILVIRWHDSGDFFNEKYLQIALDIANATPNIIHYAYTKSVSMISKANKPKNFVFNFSKGGVEDDKISDSDKKSIVVPRNLFGDLFPKKHDNTWHLDLKADLQPDQLNILKQRINQTFNLPVDSIITYKQLMTIPYDHTAEAKPFYNVLVKPGDGDDAAMRKDVITTLLLIH